MEVAAWEGRQREHMENRTNVSTHMEEMSIMQQVTQLAPSHGKEIGVDGEHIHEVSDAR